MGILSVLTIIFVIAKLLGFVAWSWWIVFAPFLIEVLVSVIVLVVGLIAAQKL